MNRAVSFGVWISVSLLTGCLQQGVVPEASQQGAVVREQAGTPPEVAVDLPAGMQLFVYEGPLVSGRPVRSGYFLQFEP